MTLMPNMALMDNFNGQNPFHKVFTTARKTPRTCKILQNIKYSRNKKEGEKKEGKNFMVRGI